MSMCICGVVNCPCGCFRVTPAPVTIPGEKLKSDKKYRIVKDGNGQWYIEKRHSTTHYGIITWKRLNNSLYDTKEAALSEVDRQKDLNNYQTRSAQRLEVIEV